MTKCKNCYTGVLGHSNSQRDFSLLGEESNPKFIPDFEFDYCPRCGHYLRHAITDDDQMDVHIWFGLTYACYLTLPRLILDSMPHEWQYAFVELLNAIPSTLVIDDAYTGNYRVQMIDRRGKYLKDPYREYRHVKKLELKK